MILNISHNYFPLIRPNFLNHDFLRTRQLEAETLFISRPATMDKFTVLTLL